MITKKAAIAQPLPNNGIPINTERHVTTPRDVNSSHEVLIKIEKIEASDVSITSTGNIIKNTTLKSIKLNKDNDGDESSDLFRDPTIRLPKNPSDLAACHPIEVLDDFAEQWVKNRIILIGCSSEEVLSSTAYQLIERPEFKIYEKRLLMFDGANIKNGDFHIEIFPKYFPSQKIIILADIKNQCRFFDSLFSTRYYSQFIKEEFKEKGILFIGLLGSQLIKLIEEKKSTEYFFFTYWKIDFLFHLLKKYFPKNFDELGNKILKQRKNGLWGKKDDEYTFYLQIKETLERGIDFFTERVKNCINYDISASRMNDNLHEGIRAQSIFKDDEPHKTALFVGAFFTELPPLDFHRVVCLLLEDKTTIRNKKTKIESGEPQLKIIETEEEIKAIEKWDKNADNIINDCYLKPISTENNYCYIDFSHPYLRKDMREYFMENYSIYIKQQLILIQNSGILFDSNISYIISDNIIHLIVQMVILNPPKYGPEWLQEFILKIKNHYNITDKNRDCPFAAITQFINEKENKRIQTHFYIQISKLIREMLSIPQFKEVVQTFLNNTFTLEAHEIILNIVLNLGIQMFPARQSEFDMFDWLKRLLDQGPDLIKKKTYEALYQIAIEHYSCIYDVFEAIQKWLPSEEKEWDYLTPSNKYALYFIIHYCSGTVLKMENKEYGAWPSKYPLFQKLEKDKIKQIKLLKKIIRWLLHPLIDKAIKEVNAATNPADKSRIDLPIHAYIVTLLEEWGIILLGVNIKNAHAEALELLKIIINIVISNANKTLQRKIMFWLAEKNILYRQINTTEPQLKLEKRKRNSIRYDLIYMLFRLCKQSILTSKESIKITSNQSKISERIEVIRIKIAIDDLQRVCDNRLKITCENLFKPLKLLNLTDGQKVSQRNLNIIASGNSNSIYELKYKNYTYQSFVSENDAKIKFTNIKLENGTNNFEIINPAYRNIENQNLKFQVILEPRQKFYLNLCDPVTGKQFSSDDDISNIIRCKDCGTFYYLFTIKECGNICIFCQKSQFWNHQDEEFYEDRKNIKEEV